jgi:hypothetical protein
MARRLVIDSNMLQSPVLRDFLLHSRTHVAVLPEFVWLETYKQQSLAGLTAGLSVIGDFPDQLIVLQPWHTIAMIESRCPELVDKMAVDGVAAGIRQMAGELAFLAGDEAGVSDELRERWASSARQAEQMILGAEDIAISLPEMAEIFSAHEIRLCRTDSRYTMEMFEKIFGAANQLYEHFSEQHGVVTYPESSQDRYDSYLYRQGLAKVIYALWWIRSGSQPPKRLDRVRNDIIDLQIAVYGTYFSGLLTDDQKAGWMHHQLREGLKMIHAIDGLTWQGG